jgi:hypothetical protein
MRIAGEIILKSLGAWVAIWGFSRLLNAPKKLECYTAGVGMIGWADRGSIQRRHSDEELSCRRCRRPGFPGNGASFQSAGDPFRDPGHSSDGAGSRYVPHRLLDRYGAGKHGWNVSFRDSDRGRRNCPWNFPRRSAAEGIFLRIP